MVYKAKEGIIKEKISRLSLFFVGLMLALTASLGVFSTASAATTTPFHQGFEINTSGWTNYGGSTVSRVGSGSNGVTSYEGDYHAELGLGDLVSSGPYDGKRIGPYTFWGGSESVFPDGGYTTNIAMYLDTSEAGGSDKRLDYSSAIYSPSDTHRRDFIFHAGTATGTTGTWRVSASNNAPGWPSNPDRSPIDITETGWYQFVHNFRDNGSGVLEVEMQVLDSDDNVLGTWTLSDPSDVIGSTVGGNGYGWIVTNDFDQLAIDATTKSGVVMNPSSKDECKKGSYETFGFRNQGLCIQYVNTGKDSRTL